MVVPVMPAALPVLMPFMRPTIAVVVAVGIPEPDYRRTKTEGPIAVSTVTAVMRVLPGDLTIRMDYIIFFGECRQAYRGGSRRDGACSDQSGETVHIVFLSQGSGTR